MAALAHAAQNARRGDVINISLVGDTISAALDREVLGLADRGILIAIAAGNSSKNVSSISPARVNHPNVFTVGAIDKKDSWTGFSNYGSQIIDAAAPGTDILSAYKNNGYAYLTGTSAAAPHTAGLLLLDGRNFGLSGVVTNDPENKAIPIPHKR